MKMMVVKKMIVTMKGMFHSQLQQVLIHMVCGPYVFEYPNKDLSLQTLGVAVSPKFLYPDYSVD